MTKRLDDLDGEHLRRSLAVDAHGLNFFFAKEGIAAVLVVVRGGLGPAGLTAHGSLPRITRITKTTTDAL